jgi:hypothetical protein
MLPLIWEYPALQLKPWTTGQPAVRGRAGVILSFGGENLSAQFWM